MQTASSRSSLRGCRSHTASTIVGSIQEGRSGTRKQNVHAESPYPHQARESDRKRISSSVGRPALSRSVLGWTGLDVHTHGLKMCRDWQLSDRPESALASVYRLSASFARALKAVVTRQLIADCACANLGVLITSRDMIAANSLTGSAEASAAFDVWMRQRRGLVKLLLNLKEILRIMQWIQQAHYGSV